MKDSSITVQQTIINALNANAELMTLIEGVFDTVPDDQLYPFITLGDVTSVDASTKGIDGLEHTITIHSWNQGESRLQLKQIMALVMDTLHDADLTLTDDAHDLINLRFEFQETYKDPDGRTQHGVQRFRVVTQEA